MWPWKKNAPRKDEETPLTDEELRPFIRTMGMVYRPPQPQDDEPEKPENPQEENSEGTIGQARSVKGGMEHLNTPRNARSFDPSRADASTLIPLQSVQIATPCRADWDKMQGDDKSRFCQTCQKSVYNLSAMSAADAQKLLADKGGDLCARIYRRADGTVMTQDCPVGATTPRRTAWNAFWGGAAALLAAVGVGGCGSDSARSYSPSAFDSMRSVPVLGVLINTLSPQPLVSAGAVSFTPPTATMGDIAAAPPKAQPKGAPEMGTPAVPPVLGRIVCPPTPRPKPTPKPTAAPEMGEVAPDRGLVAPRPRS